MARNAEKAQAMLNRFLQAKKDALKPDHGKRPFIASEVTDVHECEKWRNQVVGQIAKQVAIIQNGSLGEHKIRDLNDYINKLIREKKHWERQIRFLGGPDFMSSSSGPKIVDNDGKRALGTDGYFYFGAAKELPGVRELFEKNVLSEAAKNRVDLYKMVDADYYGYRDDDDGLLEKLEAKQEKKAIGEAVAEWTEGIKSAKKVADGSTDDEVKEMDADEDGESSKPVFKSHVPDLPSQEEIERLVLEKQKRDLIAKYGDASSNKL